jgi:hypothetical protein
MALTTAYFVGPFTVPQISEASVLANLNWFIGRYEEEHWRLLFGDAMYEAYLAGVTAEDARWLSLKNKMYNSVKKISPVAGYVYFYYERSIVTSSTGTGEVILQADNTKSVGNDKKAKLAWNEMVKLNKDLLAWVLNSGLYPEYVEPVRGTTLEQRKLFSNRMNVLKTIITFF